MIKCSFYLNICWYISLLSIFRLLPQERMTARSSNPSAKFFQEGSHQKTSWGKLSSTRVTISQHRSKFMGTPSCWLRILMILARSWGRSLEYGWGERLYIYVCNIYIYMIHICMYDTYIYIDILLHVMHMYFYLNIWYSSFILIHDTYTYTHIYIYIYSLWYKLFMNNPCGG